MHYPCRQQEELTGPVPHHDIASTHPLNIITNDGDGDFKGIEEAIPP